MYHSIQCISQRTGQLLKTYQCKFSADQAANQTSLTLGKAMVSYQCDRCSYWHLCPEERHTPSETCHYCTSGEGKPKQLYTSYQSAKRRANCLFHEKKLRLSIYECRYQHGWHLTKSGN